MPISNYIRPQTEIYQQLEVTLDVTHGYLAACVIGPQYDLYRYGKDELPAVPFKADGQVVPFVYDQDPLNDYKVDLKSVRVFAEDIQASLLYDAESGQTSPFTAEDVAFDSNDRFVIRLKEGKGCFASTTADNISKKLHNYGVQISDIVSVTANGVTRQANVVDLVGKVIEPVVQIEDADDIIELKSEAADYEGLKDTVFQIAVLEKTEEMARLQAVDSEGLASAHEITVTPENLTDEIDLGLGVKIAIKDGQFDSLTEGLIMSIAAAAAKESETDFDGIRLDAQTVTATVPYDQIQLESVDIRVLFSGEMTKDAFSIDGYSAEEDGVHFEPGFSVWIEDQRRRVPFVDDEGNLFIQYRVLVMPPEDEDIIYIDSLDSIPKLLGPIDQQNDIAYAAYTCMKGAAGRAIYVLRVSGDSDDTEAYMTALRKTQSDRTVYSFAVITENLELAHKVNDWNEEQCAPDIKNYRRTIYGAYVPETFQSATKDTDGRQIRAVFADQNGDTNTTNATIVQLTPDTKLSFKNYSWNGVETQVRPGDFIRIELTGARYMVRRVLSANEIELVSGPKSEITTATAITIFKASTAANLTEYLQGMCASFNSRRATVVYCDGGTYSGEEIANKYLAAYVAGLSSSVVPQKSITRSEVDVLTSCSRMYTKYTRHQLDEIARYGCLLITQDVKGAPCYVRHQLTTETDKGILYYEESCTRNIDNISFSIDAAMDQFIGKANVTQSALRAIRTTIMGVLEMFMTDSTDDMVGPSLIEYDNLSIKQDPVYKDKVNIRVNLYVPAPLNNIRVYEMAYVATVTLND